MKKYYSVILLICILKTTLAFGQSNVAVSPSAYLTSLPPEIPTIISPSNESTALLDPVELIWQSQIHTSSYTLHVSIEPDFSTLLIEQSSLSDTLYSLTGLENNTRYYWRVKATNVAGESGFSSVWEFTTIVALPDVPELIEPDDDKADTPVDVDLKWNSVEGAASYGLQVSQESDFSTLLVDQSSLSDTLYSLADLENNRTYYWRVKSVNVAGESDYSSVWEFSIIVALPDVPVLVEPNDNKADTPVDVDLRWNSVEDAASYALQVSEEADFSFLLVDQSSHSDTLYSLTGLENNRTYYWRVMAINVAGESDYSSVWEFATIVALPDVPVLVEPNDNKADTPVDIDLKWNSVEDAGSYAIQVSKESDFSTLLVDQSSLSDTLYSLTGLDNNTTYYWRVKAVNVAGSGSFSEDWSFTTIGTTGIDWAIASMPDGSLLMRPYPNPFHSSTTFRYFIPDQTKVHISIYNILGQEVRGLMSLDQQAGKHEVKWDGRDDYGTSLPDGLYICILSCNEYVCFQKVLLKR